MNALDEIIGQIRASEKAAESTWTSYDVCAQVTLLLEEIITSGSSSKDADKASIRLAYCLQLARAVGGRDPSLCGVVASLEYLIARIKISGDLTANVVYMAIEAVVLDVDLFISQQR